MNDHHTETRAIYHAQHLRLANDAAARARIHAMYTPAYFGIDFRGMKVLDVGCGDMAVLLIRLAQMGAKELYGVDIGYDWIDSAKTELARENLKADFLGPGNVLGLPWPDKHFDFVACNGVLLHLANMSEVERGFAECAKVAKRYLYVTCGTGVGGLLERAIFPAVRAFYRDNAEFRKVVDSVNPEMFADLFSKIERDVLRHTGESVRLEPSLFDEDFCVFLQNAIQPPSRMVEGCSADYIESLYKKHGFKTRRLYRYVKRSNFRKFFAPLHFDKSHPISRILYGDGSVEFLGER